MRRPTLFLTLLAVIAMGLAAPASARPDARPFTGSTSGEVIFQEDADCPNPWDLKTVTNATGTASHLGRTVATAQHCTPTGADIDSGRATLVAANGDEVYLRYAGTVDPVVTPNTPLDTVIVADTPYVIVGGTGRFEDAEGTGDMTVEVLFKGFDSVRWPATWTWNGTIGY